MHNILVFFTSIQICNCAIKPIGKILIREDFALISIEVRIAGIKYYYNQDWKLAYNFSSIGKKATQTITLWINNST